MDIKEHKEVDIHLWHYAEGECSYIATEVMDADQENAYEWDFPTSFFWLLIHGYINLEKDDQSESEFDGN